MASIYSNYPTPNLNPFDDSNSCPILNTWTSVQLPPPSSSTINRPQQGVLSSRSIISSSNQQSSTSPLSPTRKVNFETLPDTIKLSGENLDRLNRGNGDLSSGFHSFTSNANSKQTQQTGWRDSTESLYAPSNAYGIRRGTLMDPLDNDIASSTTLPPPIPIKYDNFYKSSSLTNSLEYDNTPPDSPTSPDTPSTKKVNLIEPSLGLLFSLTPKSSQYYILIPGIIFAIVCGLIPPYMTNILGDSFGAFTNYTLATMNPLTPPQVVQIAKDALMTTAKDTSLRFLELAILIMFTSSISMTLWVINGERTVRALRLEVFKGIGKRDMEWFDLGMGAETVEGEDGEEMQAGQGAGGLMGRFTRDTDDVRVAASQSMGLIIQYGVSFVACLILSLYRNYRLTFVVLASVPLVTVIIATTEKMASKLIEKDTEYSTKSSSRVDRILGAIATVKAFNAEELELNSFVAISKNSFQAYCKLHFVWGIRTGGTQFLLLAMFVQGFWFGSYLCTSGKSTAAAVSTCFWACLLASTFLQSCVPILVALEKGKIGMAELLELARATPDDSSLIVNNTTTTSSNTTTTPHLDQSVFQTEKERKSSGKSAKSVRKALNQIKIQQKQSLDNVNPFADPLSLILTNPNLYSDSPNNDTTSNAIRFRVPAARALRKLRPATFSGELTLKNVTFHYPTRPHPAPPALLNFSLYLAAQETTYIVGPSGSGKSTVGSLLLGLYKPDVGSLEIDEQGSDWIDPDWLRGHVACVSQGASVLFDGTVHSNVAIGVVGQLLPDGSTRSVESVTREEVILACRGALMHEFIRDLPMGYDTWLSGEKGASLSGGQRQRLAIARAWIRDPTVLILDEATSALDATSRLLVSEAIKSWRKNKTTIIITHDLTPINGQDFVYVMTDGKVVEQGYREDLEDQVGGPFYNLERGGLGWSSDEDEEEQLAFEEMRNFSAMRAARASFVGGGMFPAPGQELAKQGGAFFNARTASVAFVKAQAARRASGDSRRPSIAQPYYPNIERRASNFPPPRSVPASLEQQKSLSRRRSTVVPPSPPPVYDYARFTTKERRDSSKSFKVLDLAATSARSGRNNGGKSGNNRIKHKTMLDGDLLSAWSTIKPGVDGSIAIDITPGEKPYVTMGAMELVGRIYPEIPEKSLFFLGLFLSVGVGACTPIFSSLLSKLMTNLGNPNGGAIVVRTSLLILLMAFLEGFGTFLKFYFLERCAMGWIIKLRDRGLALVVKQDKSWFDMPENSITSLTHILVKDSEDARTLVGTVVGQLLVVISMIFIGLTWAFAVGWELTLVGLGLAPVFVFATKYQAGIQSRAEATNKIKREDVSKRFYQTVANIRAIRSMSIESVFINKFEESIAHAYIGGAKAAPLAGIGLALGSSLTYVAEAMMFYIGALLIVNGRYDFGKMIEVFSLIIFSITFSAQIMTYLPGMTKAIRATIDLCRLLDLSNETAENEGRMTFPITGHITFDNVCFSYPQRPNVPILKGMNFEIRPGGCVGIVGASGSGKSTIAALLQRLYEPSSGNVFLDGRPLSRVDVRYLRDHIAIVSQHPALFDMTIYENIGYGSTGVTESEIIRAAKAAHVHDFITGLPKGYQTLLGENASLISGGQAQRLQIARAIVRPRELLILDECTSALDTANQAAVMETIMSVKRGKTTLIVTHKLAVMEMCDRLIVLDSNGHIAETGTCSDLRASGGLFSTLSSGGEWQIN